MEEVEKAKKEALDLLRSIQTAEDVKEHDQEIVDIMVGFLTASVKTLENWFEEILSMDPDKKGKEIAKFQEATSLSDEEIDEEMNRISAIPGADEYLEPFMEELGKRITPQMEKTGKMMEKLMADLGGAMMGAMGEAFGGMAEEVEEEEDIEIPKGNSFKGEGVKFYGITCVNDVIDLGTWNYYKDSICDISKESISDDLEQLQTFKIFIIEDRTPLENFKEDIDMIEKKRFLLMDGIQKEMDRIATIPGASEEAIRMKDECMAQLGPVADEIDVLLKDIRGS